MLALATAVEYIESFVENLLVGEGGIAPAPTSPATARRLLERRWAAGDRLVLARRAMVGQPPPEGHVPPPFED